MKDKISVFVSGIALNDSKSNNKSHDDDDDDDNVDDDDDCDELNRLKQRCKDKEKNDVFDDQNDRSTSHGQTDNNEIQEKHLFPGDQGQEFNVTAPMPIDPRRRQHQE